MQVGDTVTVHVDYDRRSYVAPNHTMTHVLNYALRSVLLGNGAYCTYSLLGCICMDVFVLVFFFGSKCDWFTVPDRYWLTANISSESFFLLMDRSLFFNFILFVPGCFTFPFTHTEASSAEGLSQCDQKGSLVDAEKLRFDFSWPCALTPAQTAQVQ